VETPQWPKLWDSLTEIQSPDKRGNHFMGFLVFVPGLRNQKHTTFRRRLTCEQRLTTSSILLVPHPECRAASGQADFSG